MATSRASPARAAVDLAFEELYRGHRADVYRAALRELGNAHDAEDVTQAAFVDAYRAVLRGTRPQSPRAWLLAISENVRRRRFRTAQRRPREQLVDDADFPPAAELPYEQSQALAEALAALPAEQRRVFVLRELVGLSYDEIADEVGSTVASIQMLLFRARRSLREQLDPPTVAIRRARLPAAGAELAGRALLPRGAREPDASCGRRARGDRAHDCGRERRGPGPAGRHPRRGPLGRSSEAAADVEAAAAPAAARPALRSVTRTAARQSVGRVAPIRRHAQPAQPAATVPPASVPAAVPTATRLAGSSPRADADRPRGRGGEAAARAARCRRSCAAAGLRAAAPGAAPRPGSVAPAGPARRGRRRDRRGGRRWGERSAGAGSCGASSDAAARALGRGPGARSHASARTRRGRGHPGRDPFSPCTVLPC